MAKAGHWGDVVREPRAPSPEKASKSAGESSLIAPRRVSQKTCGESGIHRRESPLCQAVSAYVLTYGSDHIRLSMGKRP